MCMLAMCEGDLGANLVIEGLDDDLSVIDILIFMIGDKKCQFMRFLKLEDIGDFS